MTHISPSLSPSLSSASGSTPPHSLLSPTILQHLIGLCTQPFFRRPRNLWRRLLRGQHLWRQSYTSSLPVASSVENSESIQRTEVQGMVWKNWWIAQDSCVLIVDEFLLKYVLSKDSYISQVTSPTSACQNETYHF